MWPIAAHSAADEAGVAALCDYCNVELSSDAQYIDYLLGLMRRHNRNRCRPQLARPVLAISGHDIGTRQHIGVTEHGFQLGQHEAEPSFERW